MAYCSADQANLCASCDRDIHEANAMSARHIRIPLQGDCCSVERHSSPVKVKVKQEAAAPVSAPSPAAQAAQDVKAFDAFDLDDTLFDMGKNFDLGPLDMDFYGSSSSDGVVPTVELPFESGCSSEASFTEADLKTASISSGASADSGRSAVVATATPWSPPIPTVRARPAMPSLPPPSDGMLTRDERVQRYREKRKRRTFEKTIRYESRKAYAEVRPRIKGRFATREEVAAMKAEAAALASSADGTLINSPFAGAPAFEDVRVPVLGLA